WKPTDRAYGGWGYSLVPPRKPAPGEPSSPLAEPNMSATRFAVEALRAAGSPADDPAIRAALAFIDRCQNFLPGARSGDLQLDDGGCFFMQDDPVRNKA